jgi:DNA-binding NarL/FixJ family response regulator
VKVLVVDDHPLFREAVAHLVRQLGKDVEVLDADGSDSALRILHAQPTLALALFDLNMPNGDGATAIALCRAQRPDLKVVAVSGSDNPADMRRVMEAGAHGYISKSAPGSAIVAALQSVLAGSRHFPAAVEDPQAAAQEAGLTLRQMEVLALLCEGRSNKEVARALNLAEQTVKVHVTAIFKLLKVVNRTQAVLAARELGFVRR